MKKKRKSLVFNVTFGSLDEIEAVDQYLKGEGKKFSPWARQIILREIGIIQGNPVQVSSTAPASFSPAAVQVSPQELTGPRATDEPSKPDKSKLMNKFK